MIILIGGEKGGTGKSTIATNLAVQFAHDGKDVILLDADPQGTASKWIERRNEQGLRVVHSAQKTGDIYKTSLDLGQRYEIVIIDAGGRDSKELRTGMVAADKMYIPIRASQADLETLPHVDELIGLAKGMNPELQVFALLSMAPSNPLGNEVAEAQELLEQFAEIQLSPSIVRDRKVYRDAMLEGKGVVELSNSQAKGEIQLLCDEVLQ